MGYTHYWQETRRPTADERAAILSDTRRLLEQLPPDIRICGWSGEGEPDISQQAINFNGDEQAMEACENFHFPFGEEAGRGFCKTRQHPYDTLVCGVLLSIAHQMGRAFAFHSDGDLADWQEALDWWKSVFPERELPQQVAAIRG